MPFVHGSQQLAAVPDFSTLSDAQLLRWMQDMLEWVCGKQQREQAYLARRAAGRTPGDRGNMTDVLLRQDQQKLQELQALLTQAIVAAPTMPQKKSEPSSADRR